MCLAGQQQSSLKYGMAKLSIQHRTKTEKFDKQCAVNDEATVVDPRVLVDLTKHGSAACKAGSGT